MRRIGDLLRDLGFNKDAPLGSQEAFLRHLLQNANPTSLQKEAVIPKQPQEGLQLSFDPMVLGTSERKRFVR